MSGNPAAAAWARPVPVPRHEATRLVFIGCQQPDDLKIGCLRGRATPSAVFVGNSERDLGLVMGSLSAQKQVGLSIAS
jgi:hypothetical protein